MQPVIPDRVVKNIALEIVELYPYVEYMKYLLAGSIALAMYISVMIGGGMLYIDDKARGVHEGYLVTPISKLELVMGLNVAGAIKAVLSGISLTVIGSLMAGLGVIFHPDAAAEPAAADPGDVDGVQRHDVPDDGARGRSAGAARHVRRAEHAAVLSVGRDLSDRGVSPSGCARLQSSIRSRMRFTGSRRFCSRTEDLLRSRRICCSCLYSGSARC